MMMKIHNYLVLVCALCCSATVCANGVVISDVERLEAPNSDRVRFSISWQNSWRVGGPPGNHDAIWVFIKYNPCDGGHSSSHALLSTTMTDHTFSSGVNAMRPILETDRFGAGTGHNTGVMVGRGQPGIGHINQETVTLRIVGSTEGTVFEEGTDYNIDVFGIEMVLIPEGSFTLGANSISSYCNKHFRETHIDDESTAYTILLKTNFADSWWGVSAAPRTATVPANYPKGVGEMYIMKYEISQGQYVDFLNNIGSQSGFRMNGIYGENRYTIAPGTMGFVADEPNRACNFLSIADVLAYLDWAALRPMTELEYEKVAKGPPNGYAFGVTTYVEALTVTTPENGTETVNAGANLHVLGTEANLETPGGADAGGGPLGVGVFARTSGGSRLEAGATFHGVMEISGNLWEPTVNAWLCASTRDNCGTSSGYTGIWGDGRLSGGYADTPGWPAVNDSNYGWRGGSWNDHAQTARTADRTGSGRSGWNNSTNNCNTGDVTISTNLGTNVIISATPTTGGRGVR